MPIWFQEKSLHDIGVLCSVLKNIINYYRVNGSYVFACFLDMSKAFDMVNHHKLFEKLVQLKFPRMLVKLLIFWYSTQMVNVRWKSTVSSSFLMRNGGRVVFSHHTCFLYICVILVRLSINLDWLPCWWHLVQYYFLC